VKDVPNDAFDGLTIVVTGEFETISRSDLETFIKDKGGRAPGSVSGKTNYLIAGSKLEDGRDVSETKKYKEALNKKVKIYTESEFEEFV
jgi:NAD-dependent DNA ligase